MKNVKSWIVLAVFVLMATMGAYQHGKLQANSAFAPAKVGVVNVTKVLETSQKHKQWQERMQTERTKMEAEFQQMQKDLAALNESMKLREPGSEDFRKLSREFIEKKAIMDSKDASYQEIVTGEMQRWTESLYKKLLVVIDDVAKKKGLDIVLSDEDLVVPAPSLRDFMLTIKTKKVLYKNAQYDITNEVLAALDTAK
ncbi:MAG: OmpH/Skp family outer membrane protein [Planctomycetota bacterium]|jgi:Skp family chaperone for outer membrane proteins